MAGERTLPGISLTGYWDLGDNTWKAGMDENLRKLSVLVQLRVLSRTTWPPDTNSSNSPGVANGDIYIIPAGDSNSMQSSNSDDDFGDIAVHDNGSWVYYTPLAGFLAYVIDEGAYYRYNGTAWVAFGGDAFAITYNSGTTGDSNSTETNVGDALDDLYERVRNVVGGVVDATTVTYNSGTTGDSNSTETNVADALDDLYERIRNVSATDALAVTYNSGTTGDSNSTETNVADALDDLYERIRNVGSSSWTLAGSWDHGISGDTASPIAFTGLGIVNEILVVARGITKSVSGILGVQVSVDNGGSYFTASGDYENGAVSGIFVANTQIDLHVTAATAARTGRVHLINTNGVGLVGVHTSADTEGALFVASASAINALRVIAGGGGNLTGGVIQVFTR